MKVVFLSRSDWANMGYTYAKSLNKVGVNAISFSKTKHRFNYPGNSTIYTKNTKKHVAEADVVVFVHSRYIETGVNLSKKIVGVIHSGSSYRQKHARINKIFNPIVDVSFCGSDVLGFGAKNEVCIQAAIDTTMLQPVYSKFSGKREIIIGHFPTSNKDIK